MPRARCESCGRVRDDVTATRPAGRVCAECASRSPRADGGDEDRREELIRQQTEQLRMAKIRARQVDLPLFGPINEMTALAGAAVGGGVLALTLADESGGSGGGSSGSGSRASDCPDPSQFDSREAFMSEALSATGGDMSKCAKVWKRR